ncbi:hypothetical protein CPB86DRAFT_594532 [Serendipita vermifera]|nr:hypothetical protein CPB86DRAFT_594532 [Serendipita vermifera]
MATGVTEVNKLIGQIKEPTRQTWLDWVWEVKDAMSYSNVWYDIMERDANGNYPSAPVPANQAAPTAVETAAIRDFNNKATQAIRWLSTAAGRHNDDISDKYKRTYNAGGLWDELELRFFPKDFSTQLVVLKDFVSISKSPETSWEDYFKKQDDAGKRFFQIFPTGYPLHDLRDLVFIMNTLNHLPTSHSLRTNALGSPNISNESVRNTIRAHIAQDGQEPPTETAALAGTGSSGKTKCYFCQYSNHMIQTCNFVNHYYNAFLEDKKNGTRPTRGGHRGSGRGGRGNYRGGQRNHANAAQQEEQVDAPDFVESAGNEPPAQ